MVFAYSYLDEYDPGLYIGGQLGLAGTNEGDDVENYFKTLSNHKIRRGGLGGKLFLGYSFNRYFSLEGGGTIYPDNKYEGWFSGMFRNISEDFKSKLYTLDLMAKGTLPFGYSGWNGYLKLGLALVKSKFSYSLGDRQRRVTFLHKDNSFTPKVGYAVGIGYQFNEHFGLDVSISGVYSSDKVKLEDEGKKVPGAVMWGLGFTYKF